MAAREGQSLPRPETPGDAHPIEHWIMRAYSDLSTCRPIGMGVGPIPWTAVDTYCERKGLVGDARLVFEVCIRALDHHELAEYAAQMKGGARG